MIDIDGGTGGGSMVRLAVGLAAATDTPVRIEDIRGARDNPGLRPQHCAGVQAVAALTGGRADGCEVSSSTLTFEPGDDITDTVSVDIPTAGSVALVLQPLHIAAAGLDHGFTVDVDGGATVGKWAPPVPAYEHVAAPVIARLGVPLDIEVGSHGFYPEGGARVRAEIGPTGLSPATLTDRGDLDRINGVSIASTHLADAVVAERQRREARRVLKDAHPSIDLDIEAGYVETRSPGSCIVLWADCGDAVLGADALGERGKRSETVGREAAEAMLDELDAGAPLDTTVSDQIIPFLGLAGGTVRLRAFTDHVETNIAVTERFVDGTFDVDRERRRVTVS